MLVTRDQVHELEQVQRDGNSIAGLERLIVALAGEGREVAASLLPESARSEKEAQETEIQLAAARRFTDRAFCEQHGESGGGSPGEGCRSQRDRPKALRALIDRLRVAEHAAWSLSHAKRYREASRALIEIDHVNE